MAYNEIGARVKLDGEQQYREQLRQITQLTKTMRAETEAMASGWNKSTTAEQKASQTAAQLRSQIDKQKDAIKRAEENVRIYSEKTGENSRETMQWREALANARKELNRLQGELAKVPNKLQIVGQRFKEVGDKMQKVGQKMNSIGSTMTRTITAPLLAVGTLMIKTTADFDASMSKVAAVSGATGQQFDALRQKARDLGATTKFSASEAADAMNYMAMAGWKTEDMLEGVEGILNLAAASGTDLATTSDIVTDALTAFGQSAKESGRLADIMAAASSNANTNVQMMGETFKYVAPVAGSLGITMEDTALAIGLMANAGIKSSQAGTTLRQGLNNLVKPTAGAQAAMEQYGITLVENADGSVNFRETLIGLREGLGGLTQTEQAAAAASIFGARSMSGWLAVINASDDDFEKLATAIDNSAGTAKSMAEIMQDNLAGQITILKSQLQELAISFGDIMMPAIRKGVAWLQKQVEAFSKLDTSTKKAIIRFAALAAAIGPVLTITGKFTSGIGKIVSTVGNLLVKIGATTAATAAQAAATEGATVAQTGLNAAMLAAPVGIAAAIIGIATAASMHAWKVHEARDEQEAYNLALRQMGIDAADARQELESATESLNNTVSGAQSSAADMEASAALARSYADELVTLSEKSNRTTEEQLRMEAALDSLKAVYPGFNASIDEATGNLSVSTEEIYKNIQALEDQARAMAYQEAYEEIIKGIVEAEKKQIQTEMKRKSLEEQLNSEGNYAVQVQNAFNKAVQQYIDAGLSEAEAINKVKNGYIELNGQQVLYSKAAEGAGNASGAAQMQLHDLDEETKQANEDIAAATEEAQRYQEAAKELGIEIPGVTDATKELGDAAETTADQVGTASDEMAQAYDEQYQAAMDSLKPTTALFDEMADSTEQDLATMRKNLEDHLSALANWDSNMQYLMSDARFGTDEAFTAMVQMLAEAGPESAGYLQAIVEGAQTGSDDFNAILASFSNKEAIDANVADTMATALSTTTAGTAAMTEAVDTGMTETDAHMAQNAAMMQRNIGTYGNQWSTASKASGGRIPSGVKIGVDAKTGLATNAASTMAALVKSTASTGLAAAAAEGQTQGGNLSSGTASGISSKASLAADAALQMANSAKKQLDGLQSAGNTAGQNFGQGLISGMSAKVGQIAEKARQLADTANQAYNNRLGIKSPSRVMMRSGRFTAEGIALGMEQGLPMVESAARELAVASESLVVNPDIISGRSAVTASIEHTLGGLNANVIYDAIVKGMDGVRYTIDRREFQRILHDNGVVMA